MIGDLPCHDRPRVHADALTLGEDAARRLEGVADVSLYVAPGDGGVPLAANSARHGHVVATAPTGREALHRARRALSLITVRTAGSH
ncbi:hypothetical protein OG818_07975 [Streptomyces virginiae]|uniref:hypothetical protein n=1 Tax=Streptomyces virginiae TaxID=1961 RepID=UPI00225960B9|nr:hypothetical protein [Streptomyces virginiae]MCX4715739.1 hypothetical protein [Streptomyces virginiae]